MNHTNVIDSITRFVYGTTRLGDRQIPMANRVNVAIAAMHSGAWFHISRQYNDALEVLGSAFDTDRTKVPRLIAKLEGKSMDAFRADIRNNLEPIGVASLDVGQLCLLGDLEKDFANGGDSLKELEEIRETGLVKSYVLELFPWTSQTAIKALNAGDAGGLIDAYILYINPLQRFASNELWDLLMAQKKPIIALRTVAGGPVHRLRDVPGAAWRPYLQERAVEIAPIFERSGIETWTTFCMRFAFSIPNLIATVGATATISNLEAFMAAKDDIEQLPFDILDEIFALQRRWSNDYDIHATPWTM
jgi:hypothetical protein